MIEFKAWPKIPRIENEKVTFTEKIDGTNACIIIEGEGKFGVQSRTRLITPEDDNYGFAKWAYKNKEELLKLGEGHHYGEWWGKGIQRGYGKEEKYFSLFNVLRWNEDNLNLPKCCKVVPKIEADTIEEAKKVLLDYGSFAAPGWMKVEGIVMFNHLSRTMYKIIINK